MFLTFSFLVQLYYQLFILVTILEFWLFTMSQPIPINDLSPRAPTHGLPEIPWYIRPMLSKSDNAITMMVQSINHLLVSLQQCELSADIWENSTNHRSWFNFDVCVRFQRSDNEFQFWPTFNPCVMCNRFTNKHSSPVFHPPSLNIKLSLSTISRWSIPHTTQRYPSNPFHSIPLIAQRCTSMC